MDAQNDKHQTGPMIRSTEKLGPGCFFTPLEVLVLVPLMETRYPGFKFTVKKRARPKPWMTYAGQWSGSPYQYVEHAVPNDAVLCITFKPLNYKGAQRFVLRSTLKSAGIDE